MVHSAQSTRAIGKISSAIFLSRILGLIRDQVFANLFGAGFYSDAWLAAFRIPNLLRDLVAEGALSAAFVPTFTNLLKNEGRLKAWLLANLVLSWLLIFMGVVSLAFLFFPEYFIYLVAAGFNDVPGKAEVTQTLLKILSPFLMFLAISSVAMGILNAFNYFFIPALTPALFNLALISAGFFLAPQFENWGILPIHAMAVGALTGGILQYLVQLPLLRKQGFRFRFSTSLCNPELRKIASLIAPAILGVGAIQVNVLVNTQIASFLQENGPVSWLSYAFRIIYLPIGLFGVAIGVVNLRNVSVVAAQKKWEELKQTVADSIKLVALLAIPSTIGLMILAKPIVDVLFERGGFTPQDTVYTAYAVVFYALGLFAYSCIKVYVPTFYALGNTRIPVKVSLISVGTNLFINLFLVFCVLPIGYRYLGLALGTALAVILNVTLLARAFKKELGSLSQFGVGKVLWKSLASAMIMGVFVHSVNVSLERSWGAMGLLEELISLGACLTVGVVVYFGCCYFFGISEVSHFFRRLTN